MIIKKIASLLLCLTFGFNLSAKKIGLEISYAEFMNAKNEAFLEFSFALGSGSIDFVKNEDGKFVGGVEVTLALQREGKIAAADKFRLMSPDLGDTLGLPEAFLHQLRFEVQPGEYSLLIDLKDVNEPEETYHLEQKVTSHLGGNELAASEIQFLESYKKSDSPSPFAKSGYELIPLVSSGTFFFNENVKSISFYSEIYNTENALGKGSPYVVKYFIKDAGDDRVLNDYASFARKKGSEVEPILASFAIDKLKTGNYEVVLQVLNKDGDVIKEKSRFFYRKNAAVPLFAADDISDEDVAASFVQQLGGLDSIYLFIKYLWPISTDAERRFQKELLGERNLKEMRQYFYTFWMRQNPDNPAGQWKQYHENVKVANRHYATRIRPGYMSDRGRVFLTYGKPDLLDTRVMDPNLPNYQIWQYNQVNTPYVPQQTNRMFVFAEFQPSTNDFELFHSTAIGELDVNQWRQYMALKYSGGGAIQTDPYGRGQDNFGNRINDNIILDGSGSDRDNR